MLESCHGVCKAMTVQTRHLPHGGRITEQYAHQCVGHRATRHLIVLGDGGGMSGFCCTAAVRGRHACSSLSARSSGTPNSDARFGTSLSGTGT